MTSFVRRKIDVTLSLGQGDFGENGADTVSLSGLRVMADIQKFGSPAMDSGQVRIFGLNQSIMNKCVRLGKQLDENRFNTVALSAGDADAGMSQVFTGVIQTAYASFESVPEVSLNLTATTGLLALSKPVAPLSFKGAAHVGVILAQIAASMGLSLENNGVSGVLTNPYLPGTALDQLRSLAKALRFNYAIDQSSLAVWPQNGSRQGSVPLFSPSSGLVGYPRYADTGMAITALFNPALRQGGLFELDAGDDQKPYNGRWYAQAVTYMLDSETKSGRWFMDIVGTKVGVPQ